MAKRAPADEKPYRPLDDSLVRGVMFSTGNAAPAVDPAPAPEPVILRPTAEPTPARPAPKPAAQAPARALPSRVVSPDPANLPPKLDREKRVLLTREEERALERVVSAVGAEIGTSLKLSHVLRACITLLLHSEDEILARAKQSPKLIRPANGDGPALTNFERSIAQIITAALRDARPLR